MQSPLQESGSVPRVAVRVSLFGVSEITKLLAPVFPLLFHERFHFQKVFRKAGCLPILEGRLARLPVCLQLLQYPEGTTAVVKLAVFKACLGDLLFPTVGADCNLMFCPTKCYPGIIAPMAEVSTRLSLVECDVEDGTTSTLPVTILSKGLRENSKDRPLRQKPVCHTKHNLYCGCFSNGIQMEKKKKKNILSNRRQISDEPNKRGRVRTIVKPASAAHYISHKKNDDLNDPDLHNVRSDSSLETARICKDLQYPEPGNQRRKFGQNDTFRPKEYYYETYTEPSGNEDREYLRYNEEDKPPNSSRHDQEHKNRRSSYSPKRSKEESNSCSSENYEEDHQIKRGPQEKDIINELRKELRTLLDEELNPNTMKSHHTKNKNCVTVCCLCCPKERYLQENHTTSDGKPRNGVKGTMPSCSECFLAACRTAHESIQDPDKISLEEDIRKRPLFYSNLYAAYEKLSNKKNKRTVWR